MKKDTQKEILKEFTDRLEKGVKDVYESENYKNFLTVMSKFRTYSLNNQILIQQQTNGTATYCCGYKTWQNQFDRQVKRGEKGITIICGMPQKYKVLEDKKDETGKIIIGADGKPEKEMREKTVIHFTKGTVFDVSQTEGKELPEICHKLNGELKDKDLLAAIEQMSPASISYEKIDGSANGFFDRSTNRIVIKEELEPVHKYKTAIHEVAHAYLHNQEKATVLPDRKTREVQAESIAFVVASHFGISTDAYSFGYIAGWSSGKDTPELKANLEVIRDTSSKIIDKMEEQLNVIKKRREVVSEAKEIKETLEKSRSMTR